MLRWQMVTAAGLAAAVVTTMGALVTETGRIERDIAARAAAELARETTSWAGVEVSGRNVTLIGAAPTDELRTLAALRVERMYGVRVADSSAATLLPEQSPYVVTLTREAGTLQVGGFAPSEPERNRFLARIETALPGLSIADELTLARGMPDRWFTEVVVAIAPVVEQLANGRVTVQDRGVTVEGEAISNEAYEQLRALQTPMPEGYTLDRPSVVRPVADPFSVSAVREPGRVVLSGYVPDVETRAALIAAAEGDAAGLPVVDMIDLASGEPPGFAAAALAALDFIDLFAEARIAVVGTRISLTGVAGSPEAYRTLNSHLAAFGPDGFVVEANVDLPVVSPFVLTATRAGQKVAVSGFAPSPSAVDDIRRSAESVAGPNGAVVEATIANGAPTDFTAAAMFAIRLLSHLTDGSVVIADTQITLSGKAVSSGALLEIEASIALEAPEGFIVERAVQPPVVTPYTWSLERTSDSLVLSGHVPTEAARVAVRDAADDAAGDLAVTDRTALAGGLPEGIDLAAVAAFAAAEIALLDEGMVELNGRTLSIRGRTADALAGRSVIEAFSADLPAGLERGTLDIDAPEPFRFSLSRTADGLVLDGLVTDEAARRRIIDAAERMFGRMPKQLSLETAPGLPEGATDAVVEGLRAVAMMSEGSVRFEDTGVLIDGKALTTSAVERLDTRTIAAMPPGFRARAAVRPPEEGEQVGAAECNQRLDAVLRREPVRFAEDSATPDPDSEGAIAEIAASALTCRDTRLRIEVVSDDADRALAKAEALRVAIVDAGVDADRIEARGRAGEPAISVRAVALAPVAQPSPQLDLSPPVLSPLGPDPLGPGSLDPGSLGRPLPSTREPIDPFDPNPAPAPLPQQ